MCSCDVFDSPEFSDHGFRKARKPHRCVECGKAIQPGERYQYYTAKWEGDVTTSKMCLWCSALADGFNEIKDDPHCVYELGGLRECISECFQEATTLDLGPMLKAFRAAFKHARAARAQGSGT